MISSKRNARIAGLLYLLMAVSGGFGIMYVPASIIVSGDAAATANNIVVSEWTFRLSIVSNIVSQVTFVFLVLTLNRLFKDVDWRQAKLMVTIVTVAVPIAILNTLNLIGALMINDEVAYLQAFDTEQRNSLVLVFLRLYEQGLLLAGIFWGLWLLPFGILVMRSGFIPKILGVFLIIGCFAYLIDSLVGLMLPQYKETVSQILMLPLAIGEFSVIFYFLIKGVREVKRA